jgi:hypothetical protein
MKPKEPLTINLNVDWRVLAILGIIVSLMALAYSVARAKAGAAPDANNLQAGKLANRPNLDATAIPLPPQLNCPEGLLPTINGECITLDSVGVPTLSAAGDVGSAATGAGIRHFYLTSLSYYSNTALNACASGYHMASLWEILNVSDLTYDYDQPSARVHDDSGFGPPSGRNGWVRTGYISDYSNTPGTANCQNWSNTGGSLYGTKVMLSTTWEAAPGHISAWDASVDFCSFVGPVWCAK